MAGGRGYCPQCSDLSLDTLGTLRKGQDGSLGKLKFATSAGKALERKLFGFATTLKQPLQLIAQDLRLQRLVKM